MNVLVTGATGFAGEPVIHALMSKGHQVRVALRTAAPTPGAQQYVVGDIGPDTDWSRALDGMDAVVHMAARVHVMRATSGGEAEFERVNHGGTVALARAAATVRGRRFVFVSTIKVNGESSADRPFRASDVPNPGDPYARSKLAAERALLGAEGLEPVIVRPVLMYGPGVKGNLARLCQIANARIPFPFGSVRNRRHLLGVDNFADFIACCLSHPAAAGRIFLASDGESLSTPEIFRAIADALGRPSRVPKFPVTALRSAGRCLGLGAEIARLTESLEVDMEPVFSAVAWRPLRNSREGLAEMARTWLARRS